MSTRGVHFANRDPRQSKARDPSTRKARQLLTARRSKDTMIPQMVLVDAFDQKEGRRVVIINVTIFTGYAGQKVD